jgi:hypothetical protein
VIRRVAVGLVEVALAAALFAPPAFSHETLTTTVLFDREIVRILNAHCVMCHVENGPSFPLATYEETWLRRRNIRANAIARHMPPWAAVPGYGVFANDNSLTLRETQFIVSWVEGLGPRNAGKVFLNVQDPAAPRLQEVRARADYGRWQLGEPGLISQVPETTIEPGPTDDITRTIVDLRLTSERRMRALEYMPGDRRVVRAAFFTLQETGQWLGSWTPWYGFASLPEGAAVRLPPGAHIVAEIHFRGAKERVVEHGTLGLYFADRPQNTVSDLVLEAKGEVSPRVTGQKLRAEVRLTADTSALALRPEIMGGLTSLEVSARKPDGGTEILLFAKDVSIEWPTPYIFKEPVRLPRGTVLSVTAYYTNPAATPQPGWIRLTISRYEKRPVSP